MVLPLRPQSKDLVTFDEFGTWYNTGGYLEAPWLELLDHSKWVPRSAASTAAPPAAVPAAPPAAPAVADASSTVLLQFKLSTSAGSQAANLVFTVADCAKLSQVLALTKFNRMDPEYMHLLFNTQSRDGVLSKNSFDACIRQLVPGSSLTKSQRQYVSRPVLLGCLRFRDSGHT